MPYLECSATAIPVTREDEVRGSFDSRSSRPAWQRYRIESWSKRERRKRRREGKKEEMEEKEKKRKEEEKRKKSRRRKRGKEGG